MCEAFACPRDWVNMLWVMLLVILVTSDRSPRVLASNKDNLFYPCDAYPVTEVLPWQENVSKKVVGLK